jgi:hypothetical protein
MPVKEREERKRKRVLEGLQRRRKTMQVPSEVTIRIGMDGREVEAMEGKTSE